MHLILLLDGGREKSNQNFPNASWYFMQMILEE